MFGNGSAWDCGEIVCFQDDVGINFSPLRRGGRRVGKHLSRQERQGKIFSYLSELGALCDFARDNPKFELTLDTRHSTLCTHYEINRRQPT
jgi:hypothetical protein